MWLCGVQGACPPRPIERARVVVFAGDHGVARSGVSAYPPEVTAQMVLNFLAGGAGVNVLARLSGATVRVADLAVDADYAALGAEIPPDVVRHKVRRGSGDISIEDALTREEAERAFAAGIAIADEEVDGGADLLITGDMGIGNTTPAATLVGPAHRRRRGRPGRPRHRDRRRGLDAQVRRRARRRAARPRAQGRPDRPARRGGRGRPGRDVRLPGAGGRAAHSGAARRRRLRSVRAGRAPHRVPGARAGGSPGTGPPSPPTRPPSSGSTSTRCWTSGCGWARGPGPCWRFPCSARRGRPCPRWPPSTRPGSPTERSLTQTERSLAQTGATAIATDPEG